MKGDSNAWGKKLSLGWARRDLMKWTLPFLIVGMSVPTAASGEPAAGTSIPRPCEKIIFSPDGASLVTVTGCDEASGPGCTDAIRLWDARTTQLRAVLDIVSGTPEKVRPLPGSAATFSPDGKVLAAANPETGLTLWSVADHKLLRKADPCPGSLTGLVFSPDSKTIAIESVLGKTADAPREVILWDSAAGKPLLRIEGESFDSFAPQGPLFTTRTLQGAVRLWSLATGREVKLGE